MIIQAAPFHTFICLGIQLVPSQYFNLPTTGAKELLEELDEEIEEELEELNSKELDEELELDKDPDSELLLIASSKHTVISFKIQA